MKSQPLGYVFALLAFTIFSVQDTVSKHLGLTYPAVFVGMIRFWAFAVFAIVFATRHQGGLAAAARTSHPWLQVLRGLLLAAQIPIAILAFTELGLAQSQAVFASGPIMVAMLSVPILGEKVGWRRWTAIGVGLFGVLLILGPSAFGDMNAAVLLPLAVALIGATYGITTRLVSRDDGPVTSFLYLGVIASIALSLVGPFFWVPVQPGDWKWLALLCCTGTAGHFLLIRAYDNLAAVALQPISYVQLVLVSILAVIIFDEQLSLNMIAGSVIVVGAGLFTVWRENVLARRAREAEADKAA